MKKLFLLPAVCFIVCITAHAQNTGIGTNSAQAKLDVNGTLKLQHGVTVNEISTDTTFAEATDAILPTQLAVKKYMQQGRWVPGFQTADSALVLRDSISNQQTLSWVDVQDTFAYAIRAGNGLYIYDISNPDSIVLRGSTTTNMNLPVRVCVQGSYAYVTSHNNNQLNIYDISNPDNIIALGTTNQYLSGPYGLYVDGDYAYVASYNNDRLCIFNISNPNAIAAVSYVTDPLMDAPEMVWKQDNYVWVTSLYGSGTGYVHRYLVSNPTTPVLKGFSNQQINRPHDVQTSGQYAFVTSQYNNSLVVFDGSNPNSIAHAGMLTEGLAEPNHLSIAGQYAYVTSANQASAIRQIDITNPLNLQLRPQILSGLSNPNAAVHAYGQYVCLAGASNHALWLFELAPLQEDRRISASSNGSYSYNLGVWQTDMKLQVETIGSGGKLYDINALTNEGQRRIFRTNGNVGIGTNTPLSKLHLVGDQKFYGGYHSHLEFGAGIPGKDPNAGKIYYEHAWQPAVPLGDPGYYYDVLNIVGGGSAGERKLKFTTDELAVTGQFHTLDLMRTLHLARYTNANFSQSIGIHTDPQIIPDSFTCSPGMPFFFQKFNFNLRLNGALRILDDGAGSGLHLDQDISANQESAFFGMKDANVFGLRRHNEWPLQINTTDGRIGMFSAPHPVHRLHVENQISGWGDLKVGGIASVYNTTATTLIGSLEVGVGTANRHPQSGIFYVKNSGLAITGAGPDTLSRRIKFWAEGGLTTAGGLVVQGNVNATSIATPAWEDLTAFFQNNWVDYGNGYVEAAYYKDPSGVVHLRGLITGGLNQQNTVICTLPATHRPAYGHMIFAVVNGVNTLGRVDIETDGDVVFRGSNTDFLSLDQISFRTF